MSIDLISVQLDIPEGKLEQKGVFFLLLSFVDRLEIPFIYGVKENNFFYNDLRV